MTEAEWLACTDPTPMLEFLRDKASNRKARLFAVLCCRQNGDLFRDRRFHDAIRLAEGYADGEVGEPERAAAERSGWPAPTRLRCWSY
ncbi:MAG TPA: hypothetical protein VM533_21070 [Fimbriiglobus sp.]|nr:hypothetical protein [Fimbriiglobus sp.]